MQALPYRSPFRLLGLSPAESTPERLQQLRKLLLAEFELQGGSTISWNGATIDKQQALDLIEELRAPQRFEFHKQLAENEPLLGLLEEERFDFLLRPPGDPEAYDRAFVENCAPYLAHSLGTLAVKAFEENNTIWFMAISLPHPLKTGEVLARCWDKLRQRLNRGIQELEDLMLRVRSGKNDPRAEEQLDHWTQKTKPQLFLSLPEELQTERDKLILAWIFLLWFVPEKRLAATTRIRMLDELLAQAQPALNSKTLIRAINELKERLALAVPARPNISRWTGIFFSLPLLFVLLLGGLLAGKNGISEDLAFGLGFSLLVFSSAVLVAGFFHAYKRLQRTNALWIFVLLFLNVIALPVYWMLFIRNPKDKWSNVIGIALLTLIVGLSVTVNFLGESGT